jgi:hypothetical protein
LLHRRVQASGPTSRLRTARSRVGINGGYVRGHRKQGNFEVIAGKSILAEKFGDADDQCDLRPPVLKDLESIKWYLWHGNGFRAFDELQGLEMDLDAATFETKNEASR